MAPCRSYDFGVISAAGRGPETSGVRKRILAGVLWWLAIAYFWQWVAAMYGFPTAIGPIFAFAVAILFAADPLKIIWPRDVRRIARIPDPKVPDGQGLLTPRA